jgi:hypothetical protein
LQIVVNFVDVGIRKCASYQDSQTAELQSKANTL